MNPLRLILYSWTGLFWILCLYVYNTVNEFPEIFNQFPITKWTMLLFPIPVILADILITKYMHDANEVK